MRITTNYDSQLVILQIRRSRYPDEAVKRFDATGWSGDFHWHGPPGTETAIEAIVLFENDWRFCDRYPVAAELSADAICADLVERGKSRMGGANL